MKDYIFGSIVFTSHSTLGDPEDPEDFITAFTGIITVRIESSDSEVEVGRMQGSMVEIKKAADYGCSIFDVFDATAGIDEYMAQIWDHGSDDYSKLVNPDEAFLWDTLILENLYIYPEFNGHGYGLAAIQRTIEHFYRDSFLVIFKACPLQKFDKEHHSDNFNKRMDLSKFGADNKKALKSLMAYYSSGGFKRIGKTEYMYKLEIGLKEDLVNGALQ